MAPGALPYDGSRSVFLAIIGMSTYMYSNFSGKPVFLPRLNVIVPYIWTIGVLIFSTGLMWGGLLGEPRL